MLGVVVGELVTTRRVAVKVSKGTERRVDTIGVGDAVSQQANAIKGNIPRISRAFDVALMPF